MKNMKKLSLSFILLVWCVCFSAFSQSETEKAILSEIKEMRKELQEFKLQTEKRFGEIEKKLITIETRTETRFESVNQRFESVNQRFEEVNKRIDILLYVMIAILTSIFGLIGFVVWDRQVSLRPIKEESKEVKREVELLKDKEQKIETALRNLANVEPKFQEILKNAGIL
jgi:hypothetical protein